MSWGKVKKINSDMSKTLDALITEKTNIKIQTITFSFGRDAVAETCTITIDEIDTSKSIIIPLSYINDVNTVSVTFGFSGNNSVYCTRKPVSMPAGSMASLSCTLAVITFGATVS